MDIFGFKRRKAKRLARIAENEAKAGKRLQIIKDEYNILTSRAEGYSDNHYNQEKKYEENSESKCPSCRSKNVNERIKRIQGSIKGSGSGSISGMSILGTGFISGSSSSSMSGSLDTNEVNKCNDCGHEWKKYKRSYSSSSDELEQLMKNIANKCDEYQDILDTKLDKDSLSETYTSREEKKKDKLAEFFKSYSYKQILKDFEGISIETIERIITKELWQYSSEDWHRNYYSDKLNPKHLETFGFKHIEII